jgi:hypothetical protein
VQTLTLITTHYYQAYAYYEHVILPRKFVNDRSNITKSYHRAEPGENEEKTELYSPFSTPATALIEFGIGIDLYFSTLRVLSVVLLIAGLINLPNILYYASSEYNPNGQQELGLTLRGSAICTTFHWVVCKDCEAWQFNNTDESFKFGFAEDGTKLVLRNGCKGGNVPMGAVSLATFAFLALAMTLFSAYMRAREIRSDEDK